MRVAVARRISARSHGESRSRRMSRDLCSPISLPAPRPRRSLYPPNLCHGKVLRLQGGHVHFVLVRGLPALQHRLRDLHRAGHHTRHLLVVRGWACWRGVPLASAGLAHAVPHTHASVRIANAAAALELAAAPALRRCPAPRA